MTDQSYSNKILAKRKKEREREWVKEGGNLRLSHLHKGFVITTY